MHGHASHPRACLGPCPLPAMSAPLSAFSLSISWLTLGGWIHVTTSLPPARWAQISSSFPGQSRSSSSKAVVTSPGAHRTQLHTCWVSGQRPSWRTWLAFHHDGRCHLVSSVVAVSLPAGQCLPGAGVLPRSTCQAAGPHRGQSTRRRAKDGNCATGRLLLPVEMMLLGIYWIK